MNWPLFTHPALLGALAALSIPILIHLLLKSRRVRVRFSSILLFRQQDPRATQRRKLRNFLLLAARLLLVALLVLGFARPFLASSDPAAADGPRRHAIFVVDRSASMAAVDREGPRWTRATEAVRKALDQLRPREVASLVSCAAGVETVVGPATARDVARALEELRPTPCAADLGKGLEQAAKLVQAGGAGYSNVVYVVSDLQRTACSNLAAYPLPREAEVKVMPFGDLISANVAVTGLRLVAEGTNRPGVLLHNYGDTARTNLEVRLLADGREIQVLKTNIAPNDSAWLEGVFAPLAPGWHSGEARVGITDALGWDNSRQATCYVPPPIRVLVVEPRRAAQVFKQDTFFVVSALDPGFGTTNRLAASFQLEQTPPEGLAGKLAPREGKPAFEVAIVPGLASLPAGWGGLLASHVRAGGGLLLFLGDATGADRYAAELGEVLPARPGEFETAGEFDWRMWEKEAQHPMFAPFQRPNSGNLLLNRFTRRAKLSGFDERSVPARFQDGVPLFVTRTLGRGRVLLANMSADAGWTDWPKHRTYVPWLHSTVRYLRGDPGETVAALTHEVVAGTEADLPLGAGFRRTAVRLRCPDGREVAGQTDERGVWRDCAWPTNGIYEVRGPGGEEWRRVAVNLPAGESDLAAFSPREFEQQVRRAEPAVESSLSRALFGGTDGRRELWRVCLLSALVLLLAEVVLANRTVA